MQSRWQIRRRPQRHALPYEGLRIQAEDGFHVREGDTMLQFLKAILCRGRFQGKIGESCLRMTPCYVEASRNPALQTRPGQMPLQIGEVTHKV
jgi:hypothetical protein